MEKLPPELILQVFDRLLSKVDIASLRLVKRDFAQLGTEFMLNVISIQPTSTGILPLLEVSHRRYLACHVKKLVLHLEDYRHLIWLPLKKGLQSGVEAQAYNSAKFKAALIMFEGFQTSSDYPALIASSFCRLPNLEALEIQEIPSLGYLDPTSSGEMAAYGLETERLYLYRQGARFLLDMGIYRGFYALIAAAYFSNLKLVSFKSNARRLFDELSSPLEYEVLVKRSKVVLQNCRVLDLVFYQRDSGHPPRGWVEFKHILLSAARLEGLSLRFANPNRGISIDTGALLTDLLHGSWPCLKELEFENVLMPENGIFYCFLQRHRKTLRRLSLQSCELFEGSWRHLIKGIKQTWGLQLTEVELGSLVDHSTCNIAGDVHYMDICLGHIYSVRELARILKRTS